MKNPRTEYYQRINRAMNYITSRLDQGFTLEEVAEVASFSKFHFGRIFHGVTGETVFEFARRLRLENAAAELASDRNRKVLQVAVKYGFSSSQNFSRAFKKYFGESPGEFRRRNRNSGHIVHHRGHVSEALLAYSGAQPDDSYSEAFLSINSHVEVIRLPPVRVAYVRVLGPYGQTHRKALHALRKWARPRGLLSEGSVLGISWDNPHVTPAGKCRYDACITLPADYVEEQGRRNIDFQDIPGGLYAAYSTELDPADVDKPWRKLYGLWLPESGYQAYTGPSFERYEKEQNAGGPLRWVIHIPVRAL